MALSLDTRGIQHATAAGAYAILDPHNYARYHGTIIGTGTVTNQHFGDFRPRLARLYPDNDGVFFNLVNEPHGMPTEHWVETANIAIVAIRAAGAKNRILVPGNAFSGAHSWNRGWYGTPNGKAMLKIVDPADNYALEVHQYVDRDSSGRWAGHGGRPVRGGASTCSASSRSASASPTSRTAPRCARSKPG